MFIIVDVERAEPGIVGVSLGEAYPSKERAMEACRALPADRRPVGSPLSLMIVELKDGAQPRGVGGVTSDAIEESYNCDGSLR